MGEIIPAATILVVDAPSRHTTMLLDYLKAAGYDVRYAKDGETAYNVLDIEPAVHAVITGLRAQRIHGMRLLEVAKRRNPEVCVVIMTEDANVELATEAMRQGAYDFQTKPLNLEKLHAVIERGISHQELVHQVHQLHRELDHRYGFDCIVGHSPQMIALYEWLRQIAPRRTTVLITGDTGCGKDLAARAIHSNSPRRDQVFAKVNCAALADSVIESELFGHEAGAFTGATGQRKGRFEYADGGTLFLDEIGELSPATQAKLLRVLEERTFERVGGNVPITVDVRVIAATNRRLKDEVAAGRFREDLYYRLAVAEVNLPRLRERIADIPLLVHAFLKQLAVEHDQAVRGVSRALLDRLLRYPWPGNVRELRNVLENMMVFARPGTVLQVDDLPPAIRDHADPTVNGGAVPMRVGMAMSEVERHMILRTLESVGGNKEEAAALLHIGVRTLYRKLKLYALEQETSADLSGTFAATDLTL